MTRFWQVRHGPGDGSAGDAEIMGYWGVGASTLVRDGSKRPIERGPTLLQPFVNYNLSDGWYLVSSPVITADWQANSRDR